MPGSLTKAFPKAVHDGYKVSVMSNSSDVLYNAVPTVSNTVLCT